MDVQKDKNVKITTGAVTVFSLVYLLMYFLSTVVWLYAVYLSFKCNKGFSLGSFLLAFCCSPCYVAYRYAVKC